MQEIVDTYPEAGTVQEIVDTYPEFVIVQEIVETYPGFVTVQDIVNNSVHRNWYTGYFGRCTPTIDGHHSGQETKIPAGEIC